MKFAVDKLRCKLRNDNICILIVRKIHLGITKALFKSFLISTGMNNDIEEIEAFMKPNNTKRRILIIIQTVCLALSLLMGFYLFREIEYLEV